MTRITTPPATAVLAKTRRRLTPVAVRRSLYADRWLPRYYTAIRRELDRVARQVARAAAIGQPMEVALQHSPQWTTDMIRIKKRWLYPLVKQGFDLAGQEVAYQAGKSDDVYGKATAKPTGLDLHGEPVIIGKPPKLKPPDVVEAGDFLLEGRFNDIDAWIETTTLAETETERRMLADAWSAAEASRDPETGRAWTTRQMAEHIAATATKGDVHRANMLARTGTIWAMNEGAQQRYAAAGVEVMVWLTTKDDALCPFCRQMDGRAVRTNDPFWHSGSEFGVDVPLGGGKFKRRTLNLPFDVQHPPLHPYCLVGETPVFSPDKVAGLVASYSGPVVEVTLADARRLTVTPNHMLLTPDGFARAASLREGDDVVDGRALQGIVTGNVDNNREPTPIRDIVESLAKTSGMSTARVPVSAEYLHGDASLCHGEIDVVAPDGFLRRDVQSARSQQDHQFSFLGTDVVLALLNGRRDLTSMLLASVYRPTVHTWRDVASAALSTLGYLADGGVGGRRECQAFRGRESRHPELVRLAGGTYADAAAKEVTADAGPRDVEALGQGQLGLASLVPTAKVTALRVRQLSSHVYDLQSLSGLYLANGILSSNCRCTVVPVLTTAQARAIKPPRKTARAVRVGL